MEAKVSAADFWKRVVSSKLLTSAELSSLRQQFEASRASPQSNSDDGVTVAKWLGARKVLTAWQARQLLHGRSGRVFLGDYRLLDQHKTPFHCRVFSARHEPSGRDVTLVVLETEACEDPVRWKAIVAATQQAIQVSDPVVSKTWALEQSGHRRLIVCEAVDGEPLSERFSTAGPRPLAETGTLLFSLVRAVAEMHRLGIVHGGISLHTIVESTTEAAPIRLLQFPRAADPHLLPPQLPRDPADLEALGQRVCFTAPELCTPGATATATSDVYSLGCVLAALLTGQLPNWDGTVTGTLAEAQRKGLATLPTDDLPKEVAAAIRYMTARNPLDRYASAVEAAAAVAACFGLPDFPLDPPATAPVATEANTTTEVVKEPTRRSTATRRRRRAAASRSNRWQTMLFMVVAIAVVAGGAIGIWRGLAPREDAKMAGENESETSEATPSEIDDASPAQTDPAATGRQQQIVDDATLPWASPTTGLPPSLDYLPQGSQLVLIARPAELLADDEGRRVVRALGPEIEQLLVEAETLSGVPRDALAEVRVGWGTTADGSPLVGAVLVTTDPLDKAVNSGTWQKGIAREVDGETVVDTAGLSWWQPTSGEGRVLVVSPTAAIEESIAADGVPLLSPDFERLVATLDGDRHLILMGSPSFLRNDGQLFLPKQLTRPATAVADLLGEPTTAVAISLFLGETCYFEIDAVPVTSEAPLRLVDSIAERVNQIPDEVEQHCLSLASGGYGGRLIGRLPGMLRVVTAELRWGVEDGIAVLNAHLPREAAHNMLLASELALAQEQGMAAVAVVVEDSAPPSSVQDKLQKLTSLVFAKDTLEKSIEMLSEESGIPMEILGGDLQLDGITKNQSFALDEKDQTVDAILRTILRKANPDGKLVYVIRGEGEAASLAITTRAAVTKRGEPLPAGFEQP
jgi:serine/threonine protein kinase